MRYAVMERLPEATIVIKAAAVSDYKPVVAAEQKIKRDGPITIHLEPTQDILREVTERKRPGTLVIGFAAETENPFEHARQKLARKGADAIVLNDVSRQDIGFDSDRNAVTFLTLKTAVDLPEMSKRELADRILGEILSLRRPVSFVSETGSTRSVLQE
jgi:phosphopantothenoylcysteine decarboxylase/phosphopantothenate--cysteine ligase